MGMGQNWTAGGPCFHLPGFLFGHIFLTFQPLQDILDVAREVTKQPLGKGKPPAGPRSEDWIGFGMQ